MSKVIKRTTLLNFIDQPETMYLNTKTQNIKKQKQIGDFFPGFQKKPEESSIVINKDIGDGIWKDRKELKLCCWNVNGLRAVLRRGDLQNYIEQVKPDILCLNETKIDETAFLKEKVYECIPSEYFQYWNFCIPPIRGYSGVSILSKIQPTSVKKGIDVPDHENEGRVLTAEFEKFYIVVVYVPNSGTSQVRIDYRVNSFDKDFQNYLNKLKLNKNVIVCGDLNVAHQEIDVTNPITSKGCSGFTIQERDSFSKFLECGWIDTFRYLYPKKVQYSWFSIRRRARQSNVGWRLDYFLVNKELQKNIKDSSINNKIYGSDHCPVEFILDLVSIKQIQNIEQQKNIETINNQQSKETQQPTDDQLLTNNYLDIKNEIIEIKPQS